MKVAYLANVPYPSDRAHAAQITHMCQAFSNQRANVTLFTNAYFESSQEDIVTRFGIEPKFSLKQLPPTKLFFKSKLSFYLREVLFAFYFWIRHGKDNHDAVYSRHELVLCTLSFLMPRTKLIYESHEAKYNFAVRRLFRLGLPVVVISKGIYDFYRQKNIPADQLLVADDGIDESFFESVPSRVTVRNKLKLPLGEFIAMYIGGFDTYKGVDTLFRAAAKLPDVTVVAIGGSAEQVAVMKKKYPHVRFLGKLPYRELRDNQQAANVLVIPNTATTPLSNEYTSPLKLFAHMASGVPTVASDIPSLTSVVSGDDVTLVQPDDVAALAAGITAVQQKYEVKSSEARLLREKSRRYTWTERAQKILKFLQD